MLKETGRGSSSLHTGRVMRRLIAVEMALSFVLLVLAGLFIKSAVTFRATQFAFAPENVYTAIVRLPETTYGDAAAQARFSEQVREKLSGLPEVTGVALATAVPGVGSLAVAPVDVEGNVRIDGEKGVPTRSIIVTPGFFALFRASVVDGRDFDTRDRPANLPVAIVNEAFATRHFPAGALGRRIRFAEPNDEKTWLTIVGVTSDLMAGGVERDVPEAVYLPLAQNPRSELQILARPRVGFASLPAPIRESLTALDSDVALFNVLALDVVIDQANSQYTWFSILFLISGGIALFLAAIGLYGVMAFWVIQRTREIGVRMALGGQNVDIVRLVLGQGMKHTAIGLLVGVVLALPAARVLGFALYGVAPYDPTVFVSILAVLAGAGTLGCWLPARRATRMNPVEALAAD